MFKVKDKDFNTRYLVDAADPDKSDFIRYINSAMTKRSANMDVAQYNGDIFYEVKHAIPAGIKRFVVSCFFFFFFFFFFFSYYRDLKLLFITKGFWQRNHFVIRNNIHV